MRTRTSIMYGLVVAAAALAAVLPAAGCTAEKANSAAPKAATVSLAADGTKQLTLTAKAAERLDITTAKVTSSTIGGRTYRVVPFAALFYDAKGKAWVYTNPESLVFVRAPVVVDHILADLVIITDGPPVDTLVVTVGVAELYGLENGVGK